MTLLPRLLVRRTKSPRPPCGVELEREPPASGRAQALDRELRDRAAELGTRRGVPAEALNQLIRGVDDPGNPPEYEKEMHEAVAGSRYVATRVYSALLDRLGEAAPQPRLTATRRAVELLGERWCVVRLDGRLTALRDAALTVAASHATPDARAIVGWCAEKAVSYVNDVYGFCSRRAVLSPLHAGSRSHSRLTSRLSSRIFSRLC